MSAKRGLDVATALFGSVARLGAGLVARTPGRIPEQPVELFDIESCPFCRRVREVLTELDIGARIYPCPRGGSRFRDEVIRRGGKAQFPYFVDPNTGTELYESSDIIDYLCSTYGNRGPSPLMNKPLSVASGVLMQAVRLGRGGRCRDSCAPGSELELWSFEASPYCRIVREELCALEIPYRLHNVGKRSRHRKAFAERAGKVLVPYLEDPNTGVKMFESADIVGYLRETYGA